MRARPSSSRYYILERLITGWTCAVTDPNDLDTTLNADLSLDLNWLLNLDWTADVAGGQNDRASAASSNDNGAWLEALRSDPFLPFSDWPQ